MERDILARVREGAGFSRGQKRIAAYILENYDRAAFMTAEKLGQAVGVSESTVVRFATELGYDGYPEMRKALQEMIRSCLTSVQRIAVAQETMDMDNLLESVLTADVEKLQMTVHECDRASFHAAAELLLHAKHVYIVGMRSSTCLANFLGFYLNLLLENVHIIQDTAVSEIYEQMIRIGAGDVFIGISYPRYSSRTVRAMKFATSAGAKAIGITDGDASPLADLADVLLCAKSNMVSFLDSLVAPLSLINALIVCVGVRSGDNVSETFKRLETIWAENDVYEHTKS